MQAPSLSFSVQFSAAKRLLERWRHDPALFAREVFGIAPWARQEEILRTVDRHPRVAVRSGHKVSKSNSAALLAFWWSLTRPRARVVFTSSSGRQVKEILWHEMQSLYRRARVPIGGEMHEAPGTGLRFGDGRSIVGFSTDSPERMAGFSGDNLLFILDEASGIPESIFEAVEGNRAGGARVVLFSNPTRTAGTFFDAFHSKRRFWETIHVSSEETPNVKAGRTVIPGLATAEWVAEKLEEWGEDSPLFQVRVRGNFPGQASNAVIGLVLVEAAKSRWRSTPEERRERLHLGVDPARYGDDEAVIFPRRGLKALPPTIFPGGDSAQVAGKALEVLRALRQPGERPRVKVDVIGIGAGVVDKLGEFAAPDKDNFELVPVNVATRADNPKDYHNLRAQLHFILARWLRSGGAFPPDPKLEAELTSPTYSFDTQGRIKVQLKEEIKKHLGHSPDRMDALALSVYEGIPYEAMTKIAAAVNRRARENRTPRATP